MNYILGLKGKLSYIPCLYVSANSKTYSVHKLVNFNPRSSLAAVNAIISLPKLILDNDVLSDSFLSLVSSSNKDKLVIAVLWILIDFSQKPSIPFQIDIVPSIWPLIINSGQSILDPKQLA